MLTPEYWNQLQTQPSSMNGKAKEHIFGYEIQFNRHRAINNEGIVYIVNS